MELEATILERLQELRRWQIEQQERLMKQQQEQREILSYEQDRMYQALGLSAQGIVLDDSVAEQISDPSDRYDKSRLECDAAGDESRAGDPGVHESCRESSDLEDSTAREELNEAEEKEKSRQISLNVPPLQLNTNRYLNFKSSIEGFSPRSEIPLDCDRSEISISTPLGTPEKSHRIASDLSMDGVEPLPVEKPRLGISIDDMPVPSPRKDFTTLLEERLKDCESVPDLNTGQSGKPVIKRPFLRKGEGLARFRGNPQAKGSSGRRMRPRSSSLSANMHFSSSTAAKGSNISATSKPKDTPKSSRTTASRTVAAVPPVAQAKLSLKNVAPPKRKVRSKSMSAVSIDRVAAAAAAATQQAKPPAKCCSPATMDMNNSSSDFESKQRQESEEMRIFELLEEKAQNSSFCSNSSTVLALFRQSTPLKMKVQQANAQTKSNRRNNAVDPRQRLTIADTAASATKRRDASDTSLEEIVRTTKSNRSSGPGSPVTKIRETVVRKDIQVFSKWDSGPFVNDENADANASPMQRNIAAGSYKKTQHTKQHTIIQFNNNSSNNNNNNNSNINNNNNSRKPVVHSDEEDDVCNISCSTNIDVAYDDANGKERSVDESPADDGDDEGPNVSLHVRFSEYNEYKTIGLTDTSIISNDANPTRNCAHDRAWSDRSTSPESSDVEVLFAKASRPADRPKVAMTQRDGSRVYGDESTTDQTTDDEEYATTTTCSTDDASYDGENTILEENDASREKSVARDDGSDVRDDSGSTIRQENDDESAVGSKGVDPANPGATIFKSELLKTRLAELEREIDIFRRENAALASQRKSLQEEEKRLQREFRQKEENLERERKIAEESLQEEKKRLAREKTALESRLRDAREKSVRSQQERQEAQTLREQLDELREDTSRRESRWQAAQARQKSQIRVLQTENARLKQELEKLRQLRGGNNSRVRRPANAASSNTRAIHRINRQLEEGKKKPSPKKDSSSDEETSGPRVAAYYGECEVEEVEDVEAESGNRVDSEVNDDGSKTIVYGGAAAAAAKTPAKTTEDDVRKKHHLYTELLNEATQGLRGREEITLGKATMTTVEKSAKASSKADGFESIADGEPTSQRNTENLSRPRSYESAIGSYGRSEEDVARRCGEILNNSSESRANQTTIRESKNSPVRLAASRSEGTDSGAASKQQDIREVTCPDGHIEYWYPNGNVKKIFPDRNATKMIYYNGDVRENAEDGSVKYFYASTRTWHTTLPDGLEILEFPDGQVERRTKNGTVEVSFPDGSVRLLQVDGTEKWVLPDGTVAETFPDGDKILSFPNGQREVHTKEHKRREYPDGTIKLLYPDGTQETRYSTGRVRVKDKDGNLIMDVHHR